MVIASRWGACVVCALGVFAAFACGGDNDDGNPASGGDASADAGAGGSAGASGAGGSSPTDAGDAEAATGANLGAPCSADTDCTGGLLCVKKGVKQFTEVPQGEFYPPHGMCSKACGGDSDCEAIAKGSLCQPGYNSTVSTKYCFEPCQRATQTTWGALSPDKCHGRSDMSCTTQNICRPTCGSEADCEAGDGCNFMHGLCETGDLSQTNVDWGGPPICATALMTSVPDGDGGAYHYCTGECPFGTTTSCGNTGASGKATAGCYLLPPNAKTGPGDRANCARLCDCDADCPGPTVCLAMQQEAAQAFGRYGFCWASTTADPGKPCPADAGSD